MKLSFPIERIVLLMFAFLALLFLVLPLAVIIGSSFTTTEYMAFPPKGFTLHWYAEFFQDRSYLRSIALSAELALAATVTAIVIDLPVAFVLARSRLRINTFIAGLFLSPLVLPTIVIGAAILQLASQLGFARSWLALYIGHSILVIPYVVRTSLASMRGMSLSYEEAALDLGASRIKTFFLITLPIIKPGVIAGALFGLIISWVNVELSIFNTTSDLMPLPVKLFNYVQYSVDPMIAAVSAATIYVAIAIVFLIDRVIGIDRIN